LENRVALGLFGERDGEVTYASYAGMTPVSGSKARGDEHRRGDSGAPRLNSATTGYRAPPRLEAPPHAWPSWRVVMPAPAVHADRSKSSAAAGQGSERVERAR
jgi:hypothetical protein